MEPSTWSSTSPSIWPRRWRSVVPRSPYFLDGPGGAILNVASIAGVRGSLGGIAYPASKHALVGLTRNTAAMYAGTGIRAV
jgi:NAD(P)-dependent dehydrogenase (short-subunit alcohol dehydrogenase family)